MPVSWASPLGAAYCSAMDTLLGDTLAGKGAALSGVGKAMWERVSFFGQAVPGYLKLGSRFGLWLTAFLDWP